jgi:Amidase
MVSVSTLELLVRNDNQYLRCWVSTLAVVVFFTWGLQKFVRLKKRREELDWWIKVARKERDNKVHPVLSLYKTTEQQEESYPLYSAHDTRELILNKKMDIKENVAMLAKRCRKYGRNENGANAITEEFYDEAYKTACAMGEQREKVMKNPGETMALYGVPISIKDCINVKGACTAGG